MELATTGVLENTTNAISDKHFESSEQLLNFGNFALIRVLSVVGQFRRKPGEWKLLKIHLKQATFTKVFGFRHGKVQTLCNSFR